MQFCVQGHRLFLAQACLESDAGRRATETASRRRSSRSSQWRWRAPCSGTPLGRGGSPRPTIRRRVRGAKRRARVGGRVDGWKLATDQWLPFPFPSTALPHLTTICPRRGWRCARCVVASARPAQPARGFPGLPGAATPILGPWKAAPTAPPLSALQVPPQRLQGCLLAVRFPGGECTVHSVPRRSQARGRLAPSLLVPGLGVQPILQFCPSLLSLPPSLSLSRAHTPTHTPTHTSSLHFLPPAFPFHSPSSSSSFFSFFFPSLPSTHRHSRSLFRPKGATGRDPETRLSRETKGTPQATGTRPAKHTYPVPNSTRRQDWGRKRQRLAGLVLVRQ